MRRADIYDSQFAKALPLEWEKSTLESFLKPEGKTLDVGCGTGRLLLSLGGKRLDLIGVDMDREFVYATRDKLKERKMDVDLIVADARRLPFRDAAFDSVFSTGNLLGDVNVQAKDRELMLTQMARVTQTKGTITIEFVHRYWKPKDLLGWLWRYFITAWRKFGGNAVEYGDYTETYRMEGHRVTLTFHAFTTHEAEKLFKSRRLATKTEKRGRFFHDWFFVIGSKVAEQIGREENQT